VIKETLQPLGKYPLLWKKRIALSTSLSIISQLLLMKKKLNPSGPGHFELPH